MKEKDFLNATRNPSSALWFQAAIKWLKRNNNLYKEFFSNYETLFRYKKPGFINPDILENQHISLEKILQDEAIAMTFPVDSHFFDDYPLIMVMRRPLLVYNTQSQTVQLLKRS